MQRHTSLFRRPQSRRGALLLVVLSILVLFALVGLTFVVAAGAFRRGADANLRRDVNRNDAPKETDNVIMQLIRGPRLGTGSSILGHDLLRDMYGNGSVAVNLPTTVATAPNGVDQFWKIDVTATKAQLDAINLHDIQDYYTGSVLTFTEGAAQGQSHRIMHYVLNYNSGGTLQSVSFVVDREPDATRYNATGSTGGVPANNDDFVVNDPPFNGTGFGFDPTEPTTGKRSMDLLDDAGDSVAYSPHIAAAYPTGIANSTGISIEAGGADEAYDAPDYQNPFLSYIPLDGTPPSTSSILPSFHRQDLLRFWQKALVTNDTDFAALTPAEQDILFRDADADAADGITGTVPPTLRDRIKAIKRKVIFRPLAEDHEHFTGSNTAFDPFGTNTGARWDIDNDLDGVADSVWIDVGLPLKTDRQGRRYKPLAAILVKDLDALVNVNAHGFYSQFHDFAVQGEASGTLPGVASAGTTTAAAAQSLTHFNFSPAWSGAAASPMVLPLGSGYGPPEVSLLSLFGTESAYKLLHSRYTGITAEAPVGVPGQRTVDDPRSRMDHVGLLDNYNSPVANIFGTPPDRLGIGRTYFDYAGRPRFQPSFSNTVTTSQDSPGTFTQRTDDPFEIDLLHGYRHDSPFTYQELERVLRYEEFDSSQLSQSDDRLLDLASTDLAGSGNARKRKLITTSSFSVPTAGRVDIPHDLREERPGGSTNVVNELLGRKEATERRPAPTLVTLLHERIRRNHPGISRSQLNTITRQLLPPEILRGEPLDLNRLLEAPADNTGSNDVFDLQNHAIATFQTGLSTSPSVDVNSHFVNGNLTALGISGPHSYWQNPSRNDPDSYSLSRQLMARHLYVIMLLLSDAGFEYQSTNAAFEFPVLAPTTILDETERGILTKRRIAQWAINVVDFRDKDGVMTPFEFDLYPFKDDSGSSPISTTWNVDGKLAATPIEDPAYRGVVWGAEAPDLIMTESLAFHDKRVKDTVWENATGTKTSEDEDDTTLDQYRIPQGSLFLEFYNPRNSLQNVGTAGLPSELYLPDGRLHLNKMTPINGMDASTQRPVWRVLITTRDPNVAETSVFETARNVENIDTISFQPLLPSGVNAPGFLEAPEAGFEPLGDGSSTQTYEVDRVIYFANYSSGDDMVNREFRYRATGNPDYGVAPDHFLVVGPRRRTYIGSRPDPADNAINTEGRQFLEFADNFGGAFAAYVGGNKVTPNGIKPITGVAVTMNLPDAWTGTYPNPNGETDHDGAPWGIGLNISEPLRDNYYEEPTVPGPITTPSTPIDLYTDGTTDTPPIAEFAPDDPFDVASDTPLGEFDEAGSGTYPPKNGAEAYKGFRTAILQRVANPAAPYNPISNPYISVDWLELDLTVFNGEDSTRVTAPPFNDDYENRWFETDDPRNLTYYFGSRERGRRELNNETGNSRGNLYGIASFLDEFLADATASLQNLPPLLATPEDSRLLPAAMGPPQDADHFPRVPRHTLGYVNGTFGSPLDLATVSSHLHGSPIPQESRPVDPYAGTGSQPVHNNPYAWLQWNNGPFVSKYDLMMVPSSSPQRLLFEYTLARENSATPVSPYLEQDDDGDNFSMLYAPYGHLINFFHSNKTVGLTSSPPNDRMSGQFVRLFDFVHVPSRFNGTKKWFAADSGTTGNFNPASPAATDPRLGYLFPFNYRSMFREPGKINLNTIPSEIVYNSIFDERFWKNNPNLTFAEWSHFQDSRKGYTSNADDYPSRFSNPFRSAATAELMPEVPTAPQDRLKKSPVEATILRSRANTTMTPTDAPLFDLRLSTPDLTNSAVRHYRTDENPMLRYQAYQRLGNIAGTQSNVFAVWVTIGYFEVEPAPVGPQHPDGWRLAEELGNDTGEINRHRAFYIIDRSVPVGYLPGEDLNAEQTIMLKRFIE